ncbi:MAG: AroM family protein [Spirochaetes bacterium]|nr:AroM family protein [Spirochaetota bacterium]
MPRLQPWRLRCPAAVQACLANGRDGTEVKIDEFKIIPLLRAKLEELAAARVSLIVLFCTGHFPPFRSEVPLLRLDLLLAYFATTVLESFGALDGPIVCSVIPPAVQSDEEKVKSIRDRC